MDIERLKQDLLSTNTPQYQFFAVEDLENSTLEQILGAWIGSFKQGVCKDQAQLREYVCLVENVMKTKLAANESLDYEGYMNVCCADAPSFVFQCLTHWLGEGMEEQQAKGEQIRILTLFKDAGYVTDEEYAEALTQE